MAASPNNTAKIVTLSFVGTTYNGVTQELGTSGNTNTAIVLSDQGGNLVSFDNTAGSATTLQDGDNTLRYMAWVKKPLVKQM